MRFSLLLMLAVTCRLMALSPEGIPRDLALQRARQISDVRYHLQFALVPHADATNGHEELHFKLSTLNDVLLDFRDGSAKNLIVNGSALSPQMENGHISLPTSALLLGENTVSIDFTAPIAPAGKAITRFEDKDDNTEYFYTLFVPMDAEMAFPCFDQPDLKGRFRLEMTTPMNWTVISNTAVETTSSIEPGQHLMVFGETRPISTYLFAFAAGPFRKVHEVPGLPGLYVRQSKFNKAQEEAPEVQQISAEGVQYLSKF